MLDHDWLVHDDGAFVLELEVFGGAGGELRVCEEVRTFMVEQSERAWPKTDRLSRQEKGADRMAWIRRLALPDGVVEDGEARLWFGERDHPALELEPIRLR